MGRSRINDQNQGDTCLKMDQPCYFARKEKSRRKIQQLKKGKLKRKKFREMEDKGINSRRHCLRPPLIPLPSLLSSLLLSLIDEAADISDRRSPFTPLLPILSLACFSIFRFVLFFPFPAQISVLLGSSSVWYIFFRKLEDAQNLFCLA